MVGGGLIGLAVAWRCARGGCAVAVYDPEPGGGAGTVAAGMLAPATEAHFGEEPLQVLLAESARRWPAFAAELAADAAPGAASAATRPAATRPAATPAAATPADLGYRAEPTLLVALTDDDHREVERLCRYYDRLGLLVHRLRAAELREREPMLSPRVRGGALASGDHQVDPRRVLSALLRAATARGVTIVRRRVANLSELDADVVVVAAGHASAALVGGLPVRPVKGQILRLRPTSGSTAAPVRHVIRGYASGRAVYLVPRACGEVVVGATVEERGADVDVTVGGLLDLLRPAVELWPELAEYRLAEAGAGLRPGTPDNAPLLGPLGAGLVVATGHHRHGVLLTPVTADAVAEFVATGRVPDEIVPFDPARFPVRGTTTVEAPASGGGCPN